MTTKTTLATLEATARTLGERVAVQNAQGWPVDTVACRKLATVKREIRRLRADERERTLCWNAEWADAMEEAGDMGSRPAMEATR